jgi:hypothetical protein
MEENPAHTEELAPEKKQEALIKIMAAESSMRSLEKKRGTKAAYWAMISGVFITLFGIIATSYSPDTIYIGAIVVGPISFGWGLWSWYSNR